MFRSDYQHSLSGQVLLLDPEYNWVPAVIEGNRVGNYPLDQVNPLCLLPHDASHEDKQRRMVEIEDHIKKL
jgi:hypothetical protein